MGPMGMLQETSGQGCRNQVSTVPMTHFLGERESIDTHFPGMTERGSKDPCDIGRGVTVDRKCSPTPEFLLLYVICRNGIRTTLRVSFVLWVPVLSVHGL